MSFTQRDPAFLDDIVRSADSISEIRANLSLNTLTQAAVLHHLTVIREAANRVPADLKARHSITESVPRLRHQVNLPQDAGGEGL